MHEIRDGREYAPDHQPPAEARPAVDLVDIELELMAMGFYPVRDEFGDTNWVNQNKLKEYPPAELKFQAFRYILNCR